MKRRLEPYGCRQQIRPPRSTLTSSLSGQMSNSGIEGGAIYPIAQSPSWHQNGKFKERANGREH